MSPKEAYEHALRLYQAAEPENGLQLTVALVRAMKNQPPVRMLHGVMLLDAGRMVEAERELAAGLEVMESLDMSAPERKGTLIRTLIELTRARTAIGATERALETGDRAVETDATSGAACAAKAEALLAAGRAEEAAKVIEPWLIGDATEPEPAVAAASIALGSGALEASAVLEHIEPLVKQVGHPKRQLLVMLRKIGLLLDACGRHDDAFVAFRRATNLIVANFDLQAFARVTTSTTASWNAEAMSKVTRPGEQAMSAVLVVGLAGSATDAVGRVLRASAGGGWAGRTRVIDQIALRFFGAQQVGGVAHVASPTTVRGKTCATAMEIANKRLLGRAFDEQATVIADTQADNAPMLGLASLFLPGLKVVRVKTDAVSASLNAYCLEAGHHMAHACDPTSLAGHVYGTSRMLDHWSRQLADERLGVAWLDVDEADLRADPGAFARSVVEFAGTGWDDACADAAGAEAAKPRLAREHYERHLGGLMRGLGPLASAGAPV